MSKQFGLIVPGKTDAKRSVPIFSSKRNVFGDSESDEELSSKPKASLQTNEKIKRQAKIAQAKALEEDPTVFQYDELYDDMAAKKEEAKEAVRAEKKPKYIEKLLESAVRRKKENERRVEREVQKERELEGDKFADKESFVTSAYKKKLQEIAEEEEKEKREAYLEEIGEVTKQRDLGGFYRHLYEQKLRPDISSMGKVDKKIKKETRSEDKEPAITEIDIKIETPETDDNTKDVSSKAKKENKKRKSKSPERSSSSKKPRSYRQRTELDPELSEGENKSDEEVNRIKLEDLKSGKRAKIQDDNIDADSDFATDSSDEESADESKVKENKSKGDKLSKEEEQDFKTPKLPVGESEGQDKERLELKEPVVEEIPQPKLDIWMKRTVGVVFDEALKRYFQRKALKGRIL